MVMPVTWAPLVEAMVRMGPPTPQPTSTQVLPGCRIRHKLSCGWGPEGSRLCHASRTQAQAANPRLDKGTGSHRQHRLVECQETASNAMGAFAELQAVSWPRMRAAAKGAPQRTCRRQQKHRQAAAHDVACNSTCNLNSAANRASWAASDCAAFLPGSKGEKWKLWPQPHS